MDEAASDNDSEANIAWLDNDTMWVSWTAEQASGNGQIMGRLFSSTGAALSDPFEVSALGSDARALALGQLENGDKVVSLSNSLPDSPGGSIQEQVLVLTLDTIGDDTNNS